jgi:hypothetical protein
LQCRRVQQVARFLAQLQHYRAGQQYQRCAPPEQTVLPEGGADSWVRHLHHIQVVPSRKKTVTVLQILVCTSKKTVVVSMMQAASNSETSVNFYQPTRCYNPEDGHLHNRRRENLKSSTVLYYKYYSVNAKSKPVNSVREL